VTVAAGSPTTMLDAKRLSRRMRARGPGIARFAVFGWSTGRTVAAYRDPWAGSPCHD
jgi:hypothetical protein